MEAEDLGLRDQRAEPSFGETPSGAPAQAPLEDAKVLEEPGGVSVGARLRPMVRPPGARRGLERSLQLPIHKRQLLPIRLAAIAVFGAARFFGEDERVGAQALFELAVPVFIFVVGDAQMAVHAIERAQVQT